MITSTNNSQIKNLIQLIAKGKARRTSRAFVVEGIKMFLEAPKDWIESIYVSESFLKKDMELLGNAAYEVLSDSVFKHVSDTTTPQGILCVLKMPEYQLEDLFGDTKHIPLLLITESIQDPGNLGTMFRTAEGAGVTGILMNKSTVDIFNPKTIRSTMGSIYRMPFLYVEDLKAKIREVQKQKITCYAAHLKGISAYDEKNYLEPTAFLVGNEGNGLSKTIADMADCYIRIPMGGKLESLNAAMASGILMYEANRQRRR